MLLFGRDHVVPTVHWSSCRNISCSVKFTVFTVSNDCWFCLIKNISFRSNWILFTTRLFATVTMKRLYVVWYLFHMDFFTETV